MHKEGTTGNEFREELKRKNLDHWEKMLKNREMERPAWIDPNIPRYVMNPKIGSTHPHDYRDVIDLWDEAEQKENMANRLLDDYENRAQWKYQKAPKDIRKWFHYPPQNSKRWAYYVLWVDHSYEEIGKMIKEFNNIHFWTHLKQDFHDQLTYKREVKCLVVDMNQPCPHPTAEDFQNEKERLEWVGQWMERYGKDGWETMFYKWYENHKMKKKRSLESLPFNPIPQQVEERYDREYQKKHPIRHHFNKLFRRKSS